MEKESRTIVFASHNAHKTEEMRRICGERFRIVSLADLGCDTDIPENGLTLEENAEAKARWVYERYGMECFADDTGLEVDALGGAPGVHTARFAGPECDALLQTHQPTTMFTIFPGTTITLRTVLPSSQRAALSWARAAACTGSASARSLHKLIKKVGADIENFSFNTSVAAFMICVNELSQQKCTSRAVLEQLVVVLAPFAPHISEELWHTALVSSGFTTLNIDFDIFSTAQPQMYFPSAFSTNSASA